MKLVQVVSSINVEKSDFKSSFTYLSITDKHHDFGEFQAEN